MAWSSSADSASTTSYGSLLADEEEVERKALCERNADVSNWAWRTSTSGWTRSNSWDNFIKQCRSLSLEQLTTPGATLTLDIPVEHASLNPTRKKLYVREVYVEALELIWTGAVYNRENGTVFTGQPGTGTTMCIWYLLIHMIREKQVVLLHMSTFETVLFYHDQVFVATAAVSSLSLPHYCADEWDFSQVCIWSLFDIPVGHHTADFVWKGICYPVTAPSPNRDVMKHFIKSRVPYLGGLPLWTLKELRDAYPLHVKHTKLIGNLQKYIDRWSAAVPKGPFGSIIEALKEEYGDDKPESVEDAWQTLMDIVIFYLGYAPRDVFMGMSALGQAKAEHAAALGVACARLQEIVVAVKTDSQLPNNNVSHKTICITPHRRLTDDVVTWYIDFKSLWIGKEVSRRLMEAQESEARRLISFLQGIAQAGPLLGHLLEPFIHRLLTHTPERDPWPLLEMQSNGIKHTPTFAVDPSTAASASGIQGFPRVQRNLERLGSRIPAALVHGTYYVPQKKTSPLVDAFTIEIDDANCSAVLWLLQVTDLKHHDGSRRGYIWIRNLITALQDELESRGPEETSSPEPPRKKHRGSGAASYKETDEDNDDKATRRNPQVSVRYVLVRPTDEGSASCQWKMPEGWDVRTAEVDHRGPVYLLQVPIMSYLRELEEKEKCETRRRRAEEA